MPTVTANPDRLTVYVDDGSSQASLISTEAAELGDALDAFRSTTGWEAWVDDVEPLDIDTGAIAGIVTALTDDVGQFADALVAADGTVDDAGVVTVTMPGAVPFDSLDGEWEGALLVEDGDRTILVGTEGAEYVRLEQDEDGSWQAVITTVDASGNPITQVVPISDEQAENLVIHVGDGNDVVEVPADTTLSFTIWGGDGDDLIGAGSTNPLTGVGGGGDDLIFGGEGDDVINAGAGDDTVYGGAGTDAIDGQDGGDILSGGGGSDQMHGGRGDDTIDGGSGDDMIEGGSDDDIIDGGVGDDILSGGHGDDRLRGQDGDDQMMGGNGDDQLFGGGGEDTARDEDGTLALGVETKVTIELVGSPGSHAIELVKPDWMTDVEWHAYEEKIDSDLEFLRSTESGRIGLDALDDASADSDSGWKWWDEDRRIRIVPYGDDDNPYQFDPDGDGPLGNQTYVHADWLTGRDNPQGSYSSPPGNAIDNDALINIATSRPGIYDEFLPSSAVLFHELSHSYDQISGGTPDGTYEEHWVDSSGAPLLDGAGDPIIDEFNNAEWNSVGHDVDGDGVFDTLDTDGGRDHPPEFTENSLRSELGLSERTSYGYPRAGGTVEFRETEVD